MDEYGPNSGQVEWVLGRLRHMSVDEWRALAELTKDVDSEEALQQAVVEVKRRGHEDLMHKVFGLADDVAEDATQASQRQRGKLNALEIPVSASGWTGEIEGTRLEYLAPEDRFPFRRVARDVVMLTAMRPYGSVDGFVTLWSRFEEPMGLLRAEREGLVVACPRGLKPSKLSRS
jgi:hypothetical protein